MKDNNNLEYLWEFDGSYQDDKYGTLEGYQIFVWARNEKEANEKFLMVCERDEVWRTMEIDEDDFEPYSYFDAGYQVAADDEGDYVVRPYRGIMIAPATEQPVEDENIWSFPTDEIGYLLEEHKYGIFDYYDNRLYEKGNE